MIALKRRATTQVERMFASLPSTNVLMGRRENDWLK